MHVESDKGTGRRHSDNDKVSSSGRGKGTGRGQPDNANVSRNGRDEGTSGGQPVNGTASNSGPCKRKDKEGGSTSGWTGSSHAASVVGGIPELYLLQYASRLTRESMLCSCKESAGQTAGDL